MIRNNYEMLYSRPSPANNNQVAVDEMPEHLNWVAFIDRLAGGDPTKHQLVYKMNHLESLNILAYWYERDKYTERINRANERKYKR